MDVQVLVDRPFPRRGHEASSRRKGSSLRRRGQSRHRSVRLGEPKDKKWGVSGPPRRGFCLPRQTTSPRRRQATPRRACDCVHGLSWPV